MSHAGARRRALCAQSSCSTMQASTLSTGPLATAEPGEGDLLSTADCSPNHLPGNWQREGGEDLGGSREQLDGGRGVGM